MPNKKVQVSVEYDETFKKYHGLYALPYNWKLIKAQGFQESRLNPLAVSPVGAKGVMQFMPKTWKEMLVKCSLPHLTPPTNTTASIKCGCYYMKYLLNSWSAERDDLDRYKLALASYNAGLGNILKAQKIVNGAMDYDTIISGLKFVTGVENALQTTEYVVNIMAYYNEKTKYIL